jgi:hypothetical protein
MFSRLVKLSGMLNSKTKPPLIEMEDGFPVRGKSWRGSFLAVFFTSGDHPVHSVGELVVYAVSLEGVATLSSGKSLFFSYVGAGFGLNITFKDASAVYPSTNALSLTV